MNQRSTLPAAFLAALAVPTFGAPQDQAAIGPVFEDGQAQVVPEFKDRDSWIRHDLFVETEFDSDGDGKRDRMHVDVTRQAQTEEGLKVAVIYETSPYYCGVANDGDGPSSFWNTEHEIGEVPPERVHPPSIPQQSKRPVLSESQVRTWVPRGFAVVHSSSPGTGLSEGCPTVGGQNETLAPKAVIDWLCGRAKGYTTLDGDEEVKAFWSTGKVGMTGTSYNGTLPLAAATTGVEGLEAIIPVAPNTSYYHYYRSHGLVRHPGGYMGEDIDVLYDFIHSGDPEGRAACDESVRDTLMTDNMDRLTGDYNDFWAGRDYLNQLDNVTAATLMAHAFNDWNVMPEHSVRIHAALKAKGLPVQAYFHQGGHGGNPPLAMMNRWFTRYLYDVENDVESDPRSFIVRTGDKRTEPTPYPDYPHPAAIPVTFAPSAGGNGVGQLEVAMAMGGRPEGIEKLTDDVSLTGAQLAAAAESKHRLLYATEPLTAETHISGTGTVRIRMAASAEAANLSVWLVSLPWTEGGHINDNLITRGWADPQNTTSDRTSKPLVPGEFVDLEFDLQPDDQVLPVGAQIGLMIFSSDRDFTLWPDPGTELLVDLAGTSLTLPLVW